ncbi:MAG: hypothetical protein Q4F00_10130 [bacterium]|nr:hypothetical protein [bacterium]
MSSSLRFNRALPVLPVTCGVYQSGCRYEFEIPPLSYYERILDYAREHTDNQVILAYPKREADEASPNCEVFPLGTAIAMNVCEPVVRKGELWSYSIETVDTQKVEIAEFTSSADGVRLARCKPFKERIRRLSVEQTMNLLLPIWISIRANLGATDCLTSVLPAYGSISFMNYMSDLDSCLEQVCQFLPLKYEQQAAIFAADDIIKRSMLVLRYLNKAHSSGFKIELYDAGLDELSHWNRCTKVSHN